MKSIKVKANMSIAIMTVVMIIFSIIQFVLLNKQEKMVAELQDKQIATLTYADEIKLNVVQVQQWLTDISATRAAEGFDDGFDEAEKSANNVYDLVEKIRAIYPGRTELDKIIESFLPYYETGNKMANSYIEGGPDAGNLYMGDFDATAVEINAQVDTFILTIKSEVASSVENTRAQIKLIIYIVILISILFIFIFIVSYRYITKSISDPIIRIAKVASRLTVGDVKNIDGLLSGNDRHRQDEIGSLANAFDELITATKRQVEKLRIVADGDLTTEFVIRSENDMLSLGLNDLVGHFNQLIGSIITASEQVLAGSNLVSNSSMVLSEGATEQASAVQELKASLEEIASKTNLNAQNAELADELARRTKSAATKGNDNMREMLRAMEDINQSSNSISKIIKVIDDIAFQTNILALNAAVEAARAGQHGKGFAVVAEEVRSLAAKSAKAAKETTDMIEGSIRKVEAGTNITKATVDAQGEVVMEIEKVAALVNSISLASREQAADIAQFNLGIAQVSQVVQTNAATAEESAAASEELSGQAAQLKENVSSFTIKRVQALRTHH